MDRLVEPVALRAPQNSGDVLVAPLWDHAGSLVDANRGLRGEWDYDVQGVSLAELAQAARQQTIQAAREYTRGYASSWIDALGPLHPERPIYFAGHQPELFHPGVWLKNFALGRLAAEFGGVGINLIVDADDVRTTDIRVPTGTVESPRIESIPYDLPLPPQPHEERRIRDSATFHAFGDSVARSIAPLVQDPLVSAFWPLVRDASREDRLGMSLAQARHLLEFEWGNRTLELPQSRLCRLPAVRYMICHMLAQLPRFYEVYNGTLGTFRLRHRLRNHAQPMPDLETSGHWLEAPLWVWSAEDPTRRRVFVRDCAVGTELTDRHGWRATLPLSADTDCQAAVDRLAELEQQGVKLRTRALVTTLIARLLVSDLFIHGIGGARYDEVTDGLIREFFAQTPPQFMAVSGTLHLPVEADLPAGGNARQWKERLRGLTYHGEAYLDHSAVSTESRRAAESLASEKWKWIRTPKTSGNADERHRGIATVNDRLQPFLLPLRREAELGLAAARAADRKRQILQSRDYAFCLYPQELLRSLLHSL